MKRPALQMKDAGNQPFVAGATPASGGSCGGWNPEPEPLNRRDHMGWEGGRVWSEPFREIFGVANLKTPKSLKIVRNSVLIVDSHSASKSKAEPTTSNHDGACRDAVQPLHDPPTWNNLLARNFFAKMPSQSE